MASKEVKSLCLVNSEEICPRKGIITCWSWALFSCNFFVFFSMLAETTPGLSGDWKYAGNGREGQRRE